MEGLGQFQQLCGYFSTNLRQLMQKLTLDIIISLHEVRLRAERPVTLFTGKEFWYLQIDGSVSRIAGNRCYRISKRELEECFKLVCEYSIHSFQEEIRQGFVTIRGGHRVGLSGTCVKEDGEIIGMRDIGSMNFRLARQVYGVADELIARVFMERICSVLIIGEAGSGKTTLLRDTVRQLSDAKTGRPLKIAVVDERGEIGAVYQGTPQNDIGMNTDVYHLYPKAKGMSMAIRTLSPQVLVCDEIGSEDDVQAILESMNAGVHIIATTHGTSVAEVLRRGQLASLIRQGGFQKAVILKGYGRPGEIERIETLLPSEEALI